MLGIVCECQLFMALCICGPQVTNAAAGLVLPLAVLDLRVGHTAYHLSPFRSVVYIPDCIFKLQSSP